MGWCHGRGRARDAVVMYVRVLVFKPLLLLLLLPLLLLLLLRLVCVCGVPYSVPAERLHTTHVRPTFDFGVLLIDGVG